MRAGVFGFPPVAASRRSRGSNSTLRRCAGTPEFKGYGLYRRLLFLSEKVAC